MRSDHRAVDGNHLSRNVGRAVRGQEGHQVRHLGRLADASSALNAVAQNDPTHNDLPPALQAPPDGLAARLDTALAGFIERDGLPVGFFPRAAQSQAA